MHRKVNGTTCRVTLLTEEFQISYHKLIIILFSLGISTNNRTVCLALPGDNKKSGVYNI